MGSNPSSSARVSKLTYQTVIGVRYPELVRPTTNGWQYGRYVSAEATLQGGFLPVFWDVPKSTMHAVSDVGALVEWLQEHIEFGQDSTDNLAVLHNQNHMVHEFGLSAWVTQSRRQVISRSVTSCAGMTAYMVVVAQTGGRGEKFRKLPEEERRTQEEEAYARATVALTRARKICVISCPLDMKGLIGAATVMGSLMYGAGHCWNGMVNMHLRNSSLDDCLSDDQFLSFLDHADVPPGITAQRRYPPVALIECVADLTQTHYKVRRLHLVIVDLWRPWKIHKTQVRSLTDQLRRLQPGPHSDYTTPLAPMGGKTPLHGRRFVYGYSLDGSDFPCYLVWPWRTEDNSFFLLESQTHRYVALDQAGFLHPLGLRHFYDGFSLRAEISIRAAALVAFGFQENELSSDLILSQAAVLARGWADHQEQPVDQNAPEADRRNVPEEIISVSDSEVDRESTIGGCSSQASCSTTSSDYLNVWFPAHWAPIVLRELHSREGAYRKTHKLWFDDPQDSTLPGSLIKERMPSVVGSFIFTLELWMVTKICPRSLVSSKLIGLTSRLMIFYSNLLPSRMVFFVGCLSSKLLVPGMAVAPRRPR